MHTSSIYTRQRMGIDNNVWVSMLTCIVLSAGLLGYNVNNRNKIKPCQPIDFAVNGLKRLDSATFKTGAMLMFRSGASVNDQVTWDFGDGTAKQTGYDKQHVFAQPGIFTVRAMVNDLCLGEKRVVIEKVSQAVLDTAGNVLESIVGVDEAKTNETVTFNTMLAASTYEWRIDKNNFYPVLKEEEARYTFKTEGAYTVVLTLDNDKEKKYFKTVIVSKTKAGPDEPPKPKPLLPPLPKISDTGTEKPKEPEKPIPAAVAKEYTKLADEGFKTYLQIVVCGNMDAADFNNYLCKGENTPVVINNQEQKTFGELCREIHGKKKIEITSVVAARDDNKCAVSLNIKYEKRGGILGLGKKPCN